MSFRLYAPPSPDLTFHTTVLEGSPVGAPTDWAVGAKLLVVGSHAPGRFRDYVVSTHAAQIAADADDSVVAVPAREEHRGTGIVVGVDALVAAATGAGLLVVGSRGRHWFARFWLGSVSHVLVLTMPCPVAVIRADVTAAD